MTSRSEEKRTSTYRPDRFLFGRLHISHTMQLIVAFGLLVILGLVGVLYLKFKKAMFVLLIPTSVSVMTVAAILSKKHKLVWPVISISMFHVVLASYALLIFSFYFVFKPFYIIMVLNWAFDTLHTDKTPSYYAQCSAIFAFLFGFIGFNAWQGHVCYHFKNHLDALSSPEQPRQPTVLVVNKQQYY